MHQSSLDKMSAFRAEYLTGKEHEPLHIVDLGSQDVNGTYRPLFNGEAWTYTGIDMCAGDNVDITLANPYRWREIRAATVDVLISGQAFEHIEFFWLTMLEIERVLKPQGFCCIIVPSGGFEHRYPVDCWRFYPDGLQALARFVRLDVVSVLTQWDDLDYADGSDVWHDSVLICRKPACSRWASLKRQVRRFVLSQALYHTPVRSEDDLILCQDDGTTQEQYGDGTHHESTTQLEANRAECIADVAISSAPTVSRATLSNAEYATQLQKEQDAFTDLIDVHALPDIFHYWSNKFLLPKFNVYGFSSVDEFFVNFMEEVCISRSGEHAAFISLGAGNCDTETRLAKALITAGITNFHIECQDINDTMLARGVQISLEEGVEKYVRPLKADFNTWVPEKSYDGVLANQSLHHVLELEHLFDQVVACLPPHGKFMISDMIGRNGHQRWPEALDMVHHFWGELPGRYRYNHLLRRHEHMYENWDCSTEGFEGVRAQDILPLLNERFHYQLFVAFSNVIDIFIDRCFGHNFSPENEWDRQFIDRVEAADEASIFAGKIKPTHMMAVLSTDPKTEMLASNPLTPEFCVRWPNPV